MEKYDSLFTGHIGETKNHHRMVSRTYHWPCTKEDIAHFAKAWMEYEVNRASYRKQGGLLQPFLIPPEPWYSMCMDLITSLPELQGYDAILLMVEPFGMLAHMVPI